MAFSGDSQAKARMASETPPAGFVLPALPFNARNSFGLLKL